MRVRFGFGIGIGFGFGSGFGFGFGLELRLGWAWLGRARLAAISGVLVRRERVPVALTSRGRVQYRQVVEVRARARLAEACPSIAPAYWAHLSRRFRLVGVCHGRGSTWRGGNLLCSRGVAVVSSWPVLHLRSAEGGSR